MLKKISAFIIILAAFNLIAKVAYAQPAWSIDLLSKQKKPEKFENRKLGSERLADKKFTPIRHVFQNNFTHYNYYYNANNKINAVIERAKIAQVDDYTKLLSFYPYSLENTSKDAGDLDSVIYKATAGILLHDLRNDWIDNMYLLMGKAYFYRKYFDSAAATFQFINYNLYPRKKRSEDDDRVIGTNYDATNNTVSIANKEKLNIVQKIVSKPPSRNDALVWLVKTFIEQDELGAAAGLIKTLQTDSNFPNRLKNDLDEVNSYWYYKQANYDSAAAYLEKGLNNASTKQDKARSEFLLAQLYEITKKYSKASEYYQIAAKHTTSPIMDIYANLNDAKMQRGTGKEIEKSIDNLLHMAKKDKFESYRDIIFYSAGELSMIKPDTSTAIALFNKSLHYNSTNMLFKNKAFVQLADIAFNKKDFKTASANLDSLDLTDTTLGARLPQLIATKNVLSKIVTKINAIEREDSLQQIAAMTPAVRDAFIKKLSKKLRKEKGLKEEEDNGGIVIGFEDIKDKPVDLFANSNKGEWYFYNTSAKSRGLSEFKRKWGTRANADNWRRKASLDAITNIPDGGTTNPDGDLDSNPPVSTNKNNNSTNIKDDISINDISYDGLLSHVPLTPEKLIESNTTLSNSLFDLAQLFQNNLEDYPQAINTYDTLLKRYPDSLHKGEVYFGLYYCYNKLSDAGKAAYYKNLLTSKLPTTKSALLLTNPAAAKPEMKNTIATARYEKIYNSFIEGDFVAAIDEKKSADSLYGKNYWTPQLLYIEAIYHVKQKEDSIAIKSLKNIIQLYPKSSLATKAERLIDVLGRRAAIEKYLTELQITRAKENETVAVNNTPLKKIIPIQNNISTDSIKKNVGISNSIKKDTIKQTPVIPSKLAKNGIFIFNESLPQNVIMLLDKVDGTYVNEAKNAFGRYITEGFQDHPLKLTKDTIDATHSILIFSLFTNASNAMAYLEKLKKAAPDEVSWLAANKYSFYIISDENLEKLKKSKDLIGYKALLVKLYPNKF